MGNAKRSHFWVESQGTVGKEGSRVAAVRRGKSLGKCSSLPEFHSEFSDSLKRKEKKCTTHTHTHKKQNANPLFGQSTRNNSKAADSAENGNCAVIEGAISYQGKGEDA